MNTHQRQLRIVYTIEITRLRAFVMKAAFIPNSKSRKMFFGVCSYSSISLIYIYHANIFLLINFMIFNHIPVQQKLFSLPAKQKVKMQCLCLAGKLDNLYCTSVIKTNKLINI